ncbi:MAG TPA: phosphotransferase [Phycisphaerae bacterium]|nr:phosphotransferase [Phycisphaerae bacterium]
MRYGLITSRCKAVADRIAFPAQSSVLDEAALFLRVVKAYDLDRPSDCRFLSRGDSDVYRVCASGKRYYLKVYRPPHGLPRAEAEARFVRDLHAAGAPVVPPVPRRDGRYACEAVAAEGRRPILLFEEAPVAAFSAANVADCCALGRAVATLHDTADSLDQKYDLPVFDGVWVLNRMFPYARSYLSPRDYAYTRQLLERVTGLLHGLPTSLPHFGVCHRDLALSNIRQTEDGRITFFDFGDASYTWRAYELAALRERLPGDGAPCSASGRRDALLEGYSAIRAVPAGIPECIPALVLLGRLLWFCAAMAKCPLRMGTDGFSEQFICKELSVARDLEAQLPAGA